MSVGTNSGGFTVWFTGMAGAGKTTLAAALAQRLRRLGWSPEVLDGADVFQMLSVGHGQNKDERNAEAKRLAWVCRLITRGGGIVFQSAVQSPNREARDEARRQIGRFVEVFVDCQIDQLIARDRTGQYKKALSGELRNLPGISEPYEPPTHPEVLVDTGRQSVDEAVEHLIGQLTALRYIDLTQAGLKSRPKLSALPKIPLRPPPLQPVPQPVLYKPPPKPMAAVRPGHAAEAAKGDPRHDAKAGALRPPLKPVPAPTKVAPKPAAKAPPKPMKVLPKPKLVKVLPKPKLVVSRKSRPAAKVVKVVKAKARAKARPAHAEPRRAAGGRKR